MGYRQKLAIPIAALIILLGAAIFYIISGRGSQPEGDQVEVRYAAPMTIAAAPVYVADAKGFWQDEGIDVQVTYFDSGRKALDALLSDNADVMSVSETPPLRAYLAGSKINTIATVGEHREGKMTVRTDRITNPEDVKGKKIGTVAGTNSDYYMYRWLETQNIGLDEVEIIPLDATALSQAFVQGSIDVMFAWEPHNYNAVSKIPDLAESWPTEQYSGRHTIEMNTVYLQDNGDVAESIIRGFIKAEEFIENNPEEAKQIVIERTSMSREALDGLWDEYMYKVQLDDEFLSILNGQTSWINENSDNTANLEAKSLVDSTFLRNVDDGRVGELFKIEN